MITSRDVTWGGAFVKRAFKDHISVVSVEKDPIFEVVHVTIRFDKNPDQEYVFDIDEEDFENNKDAIAREVLRQLKSD